MAASETNRNILYYTFNNEIFAKQLNKIYLILKEHHITIGKNFKYNI